MLVVVTLVGDNKQILRVVENRLETVYFFTQRPFEQSTKTE